MGKIEVKKKKKKKGRPSLLDLQKRSLKRQRDTQNDVVFTKKISNASLNLPPLHSSVDYQSATLRRSARRNPTAPDEEEEVEEEEEASELEGKRLRGKQKKLKLVVKLPKSESNDGGESENETAASFCKKRKINSIGDGSGESEKNEIVQIRTLKSQSSEGSSKPIEINEYQIYYDVVGEKKKQRMYDLGFMTRSIYHIGSSSAPTASAYVDLKIVEQQLQNIREQMSTLEETRIRQTQRHQEELAAQYQRHQQEIETLYQKYQDDIISFRQQLQSQQELIHRLETQFQQSLVFQQQMQQLFSFGLLPSLQSAPPLPPPSDDSPQS